MSKILEFSDFSDSSDKSYNSIDLDSLSKLDGFKVINNQTESCLVRDTHFDKIPRNLIKLTFEYRDILFYCQIPISTKSVRIPTRISIVGRSGEMIGMVFTSLSKVNFNLEFFQKSFDPWINRYNGFLLHHSIDDIGDLLVDMDGVDINKKLKYERTENEGWVSELTWEVYIDIHGEEDHEVLFTLDLLKELSDFIERMEAFGFICKNSISHDGYGFSVSASKNI